MVELRQWEQIADFGKKIVKTLKTRLNDDPLRVWMAHYIAELMKEEKSAKSERHRNSIREEGSDLIIRLWSIRHEFDPNDPINSLNQNIKILVGKDPFREPFVNCSDKEVENEEVEETVFEHCLGSILERSEKEKKVVMATLTTDVSAEDMKIHSKGNGQNSDNDLAINIKALMSFQNKLVKDDPILKSIVEAKTESERKNLAMQALWEISKQRRKLIKKL